MRQADPYVGREILTGQFKVLERIGSGGMGAVYKAQQPSMDRFVAVKILHSKFTKRKDLVSRFRREARAMSHLTHPNTAKVFLYGQLEDEACYIVMEYLEGRNLGQVVRQEGPMKASRAIKVLVQACGALEEAHQKGIVHRDLKPENIFLCQQGGIEDFVKVLDFGLAKVTEREMQPGSLILTQEGMVFGTPEFMSPEQAQGRALDPRSDVYSLAVILYELVTGKLPFEARTPMEYISLHVQATPIPLIERAQDKYFPAGLQEVLDIAMSKKPEDRYQSAAEFATALSALVRDEEVVQAMGAIPDSAMALAQTMPQQQAMHHIPTPRPLPAAGGGGAGVATVKQGASGPNRRVTGSNRVATGPKRKVSGSNPLTRGNGNGQGAMQPAVDASSNGLANNAKERIPTTEVLTTAQHQRQGLPVVVLIAIGVVIGLLVAFVALWFITRLR